MLGFFNIDAVPPLSRGEWPRNWPDWPGLFAWALAHPARVRILRLLTLPSAWSGFRESNTTGTSCLGPLAGLQEQQRLYQNTVWVLADPQSTTLTLVARPVGAGVSDTLPLVVKVGVRTAHRHDRST